MKTVVKNSRTTTLLVSAIPTKLEGGAEGTCSCSGLGLVWAQAGVITCVLWDQAPPYIHGSREAAQILRHLLQLLPACALSSWLQTQSFLFHFQGGKKIVFFKWLCGKHSLFPLLLGLCLFSQQCLMLRRRGMVISQPCELGLGRGVTQPAPGHSCCPQPHLVTLWHFSVLYCCSQ